MQTGSPPQLCAALTVCTVASATASAAITHSTVMPAGVAKTLAIALATLMARACNHGAAARAHITLRRSLSEEGAKPKRVRFKALKSSRSASEALAVCRGRNQPPMKSGGSFWAQAFEG